MTNHTTLRAANEARQAEWDPTGKVDLAWRINELAGEVGEVCNLLKKIHRERLGIKGSRATKEQVSEELADVMICIDLTAITAGLGQIGSYVPSALVAMDDDDIEDEIVEPTLPVHGCLLAQVLGRVAAYGTSPDLYRPEAHAAPLLSALKSLGYTVSRVADAMFIDLRAGVAQKFNSTSENNGFQTRLRAPC